MGRRTDMIAGLGGATPALRRFARALCAGAGPAVADDLVQNALQSVGARLRAREQRPADTAAARIETDATRVARAQKKRADAPRPAARHPPIVHGLASLAFDERAMLLLVSLEGFGYDAAARIIGASREAALARLMRARAALGAEGLRPVASSESGRRAVSHLRVVK
ncbi:MAG: sigma factor-like helix-turn-helix DNA-binding protein [Methylocystis sp.]|uniref:sigma factor-like helix-turn-helix DNA-binding protein n=1 Tax=Methylocystis sp. TaxID=1911079 RepID=UPI003D10139E